MGTACLQKGAQKEVTGLLIFRAKEGKKDAPAEEGNPRHCPKIQSRRMRQPEKRKIMMLGLSKREGKIEEVG